LASSARKKGHRLAERPGDVELHLGIGAPGKTWRHVHGLAAESIADQADDGVAFQDALAQDLPDVAIVRGKILLEHHLDGPMLADARLILLEGLGRRLAQAFEVETRGAQEDAIGPFRHGRILSTPQRVHATGSRAEREFQRLGPADE